MGKDLTKVDKVILMCSGYTCTKKGSEEHILALRACIKDNSLEDKVHTIKTLCMGQCESGPTLQVYPGGIWYKEMTVERAKSVITSHVMKGQLLDNILFKEGDAVMHPAEDLSFKTKK